MNTPIIVTSASNITLEQALSNGFNDLLKKPFSRADVFRILESFLKTDLASSDV